MGKSISVIGSGSWGTALAILLSNNGHQVYLWNRNQEFARKLKHTRENKKYLPNVKIPDDIIITADLSCIEQTNLVILAVSSQSIREICIKIKPFLKGSQILVNVAKGLEYKSLKRMSEVINKELPENKLMILSGPSHAEEVARNIPTAIVLAGQDKIKTRKIQEIFMSSEFRVYTNPDVIGVELGGALKNIIALAVGISDGLGYGDNTKAALMSRGIVEISRFGQTMGANISTFSGLSGIGDLIVTCTSNHSRNRRAGILLGQGKNVEEVLEEIGMVVEGINTVFATYKLSSQLSIEMPITTELYNVLYKNADVSKSVTRLMLRHKKHEMEEIDLNASWL